MAARGGLVRLHCKVQNYEWGRIGDDSEVGRLHALMTGNDVEQDLPYAELWMGTHDSGPSLVMDEFGGQEMLLKDWLQQHPEALGEQVLKRWNGELPFLFKVLSVAKALSIQAHPDKKMAEYLHETNPKIYKDSNHKPELALAITEFGALCGFVSAQELKNALNSVPELSQVLGEKIVDRIVNSANCGDTSRSILQEAFTYLMTLEQDSISQTLSALVSRLRNDVSNLTNKELLILDLEKQYPGDVGVLSAFFLNHIKLFPGEAIFLSANEPHAYLYGECIECMATSDNVVRAGLTPKFRDTQTLCSMLTYKQGMPEILSGKLVNGFTRRYTPPLEEFEVDHIRVPVGATMKLSEVLGPSIYLVFKGVGVISEVEDKNNILAGLVRGNIFLVVADKALEISAVTSDNNDDALELYRAGVSGTSHSI